MKNMTMMPNKVKRQLVIQVTNIYNESGQASAFEFVRKFNDSHIVRIPFERCEACDTNTPSIDHECLICGQETKTTQTPKFYQSVLKPVKDVIKYVYPQGGITLEERLGDCSCANCGGVEWILLPKECVAVREGGKQYIECIGCGEYTHL
jgi:hypothetical protein